MFLPLYLAMYSEISWYAGKQFPEVGCITEPPLHSRLNRPSFGNRFLQAIAGSDVQINAALHMRLATVRAKGTYANRFCRSIKIFFSSGSTSTYYISSD
jgi:hypothetical protein